MLKRSKQKIKKRLYKLSESASRAHGKVLGKMKGINVKREFIQIGGKSFYVARVGSGEPVIFLLGWLANVDYFGFEKGFSTSTDLLKKYEIITPHLSNFYKSGTSRKPMDVDDYVKELKLFIDSMGFDKVSLMGHSAGGRLCIAFAAAHPERVNKMVLLNSAGVTFSKPSKERLKYAKYHFARFDAEGREDDLLKETFINIFNSNIYPQIRAVTTPTYIIWGKNDTVIKLKYGLKLHEMIKGSQLKVYERLDHMTVRHSAVFKEALEFINK